MRGFHINFEEACSNLVALSFTKNAAHFTAIYSVFMGTTVNRTNPGVLPNQASVNPITTEF